MSDKSKKILIISIIVIAIIAVIVVICCNSNVEKIKNNIIIKGEIIKNKIDIAFFTENKKEFKEQCEKMRSIIKFLPKKSRKEITFNMTIKEAIIDKDVKKVNELSQQLEKRKNLLDKIMDQYYKGVVL